MVHPFRAASNISAPRLESVDEIRNHAGNRGSGPLGRPAYEAGFTPPAVRDCVPDLDAVEVSGEEALESHFLIVTAVIEVRRVWQMIAIRRRHKI
jgi:hypothetical protein